MNLNDLSYSENRAYGPQRAGRGSAIGMGEAPFEQSVPAGSIVRHLRFFKRREKKTQKRIIVEDGDRKRMLLIYYTNTEIFSYGREVFIYYTNKGYRYFFVWIDKNTWSSCKDKPTTLSVKGERVRGTRHVNT